MHRATVTRIGRLVDCQHHVRRLDDSRYLLADSNSQNPNIDTDSDWTNIVSGSMVGAGASTTYAVGGTTVAINVGRISEL